MRNTIEKCIHEFMSLIGDNKVEIYNEFSLQHELGIFLREVIGTDQYKIQFERNVNFFQINKEKTIKKEIDIVIFNDDKTEKYAIELKFPMNGQYPESMYSFVKDIKFCEQLRDLGFNATFAVTVASDSCFFGSGTVKGIYQYFRNATPLTGKIDKPTGKTDEFIEINDSYLIEWLEMKNKSRYYIVSTDKTKVKNRYISNKEISKDTQQLIDNSSVIKPSIKNRKVKPLADAKNPSANEIRSFIRCMIDEAKNQGQKSITIISGDVVRKMGIVDNTPSVCIALDKIRLEYPNSEKNNPRNVKKYSTTLEYVFNID